MNNQSTNTNKRLKERKDDSIMTKTTIKKSTKALCIALAIILLAGGITSAAVFSNHSLISRSATNYNYMLYWGEDNSIMKPQERGMASLYKQTQSGNPVYSLNLDEISNGMSITKDMSIEQTSAWTDLTNSSKKGVSLASMYGYPNNFSEYGDAAYYATQVIIWEYALGYRTDASATDPEYGINGGYNENNVCSRFLLGIRTNDYTDIYNVYCCILKEIAQHTAKPQINGEKHVIKLTFDSSVNKYTGTFTDTNGILNKYDLTDCNPNLEVNIDDNTITVSSPTPITLDNDAEIKLTKRLTNCAEGKSFYNKKDNQTYIQGTIPDPQNSTYEFYTDSASLEIKKESEDNIISGVSFNVKCDAIGYNQNFVTDSNGLIEITGLPCGQSFVVTEASSDKYVAIAPYTTPALTSAGLQITFNNRLKKGSVTVNKTDAVDGTPLAGARYCIFDGTDLVWNYDINDNYWETDENGQLTVNCLPAGDYQIKEAKAPEGYEIDSNKYDFTIIDSATVITYNLTNQK